MNIRGFDNVSKALISAVAIALLTMALSGTIFFYYFVQVFISSFLLLLMGFRSISAGSTVFHPMPLVCFVLIFSMVLSPVINEISGFYLSYPPKVIDFSLWTKVVSVFYATCVLFLFFGYIAATLLRSNSYSRPFEYVVSKKRILVLGGVFLSVSLVSQIYIYSKLGGVYGYMSTWTESRDSFSGMGAFFMLAEAFPIVLVAFLLYAFPGVFDKKGIVYIAVIFLAFFILKMYFGGLRGSRSNTIWGIFWFAGIYHVLVYRMRWLHFLVGAMFLMVFMSSYSLYKTYGVGAFSGDFSVQDSSRYESGSPVIEIALSDFSRSGIHSFLLHEAYNAEFYEYKYGQTYLSALGRIVPFFPSSLLASKNSAGAELVYGFEITEKGAYFHNSRIYGLFGEAVLNFGVVGPFFLFFVAGFIVTKVDAFCRSLRNSDARKFFIPFISIMSLMLVLADMDNFLFFTIKNGFIVAVLFVLASRKKIVPEGDK